MQNDQRPIYVLAAPRTGSTLLTELIYVAFRNQYRYQSNRQELFAQRLTPDRDIEHRLQEIEQNTYCFKLLCEHVIRINSQQGQSVLERINQHYQPVYIQRRDRIEQLLSWQYLLQNWTMAKNGSLGRPFSGSIYYNIGQTENILGQMELYNDIRKQYPSRYPTIYYEDLAAAADRSRYICQQFRDLDRRLMSANTKQKLNTASTNQIQKTGSYRDMIENKADFEEHMLLIRPRLERLEG